MCYQQAGPQGSETWGKQSLTAEEVKRVIRDAIHIETLTPRFHLSGGEALLDVVTCVELFREAKAVGYLDITATSNAYWAAKPERARSICERLRETGVTTLEISWDFWHKPYVRADAVSNCIDACREFDIESNLRLLSTRSHSYEGVLGFLRPESVRNASRIFAMPVLATGRAVREIPRDDFHAARGIEGNCHSVLNLTVNAKGNVFPCCAGLDQTDNHIFGNVREESIVDIAKKLNRSPLVRTIVFSGIAALSRFWSARASTSAETTTGSVT